MTTYNKVSSSVVEQGKIRNSSITTSSIDMNSGVITSHGTPIADTDVVNKLYIDNRIRTYTINLTGTSPSNLIIPPSTNILKGDLTISIISISSPGGPSAKFFLSKSHQSLEGSVHRISTSAGFTTQERLRIEWNSASTPVVYKTGINYDGVYQVFLIPNIILL